MRKQIGIVIACALVAMMAAGCASEANPLSQQTKTAQANPVIVAEQNEKKTLKVENKPNIKKEQIRRFQVSQNNKISYELNYSPKVDKDSYLYWEMTVPYKTIATVNTESMYQLFQVVEAADLTKMSCNTKNIDTGIQKSNTSIRIEYAEGENAVQAEKMFTLKVGKRTPDNKYYCSLNESKDQVILVDSTAIDTILTKKPYDMILKIPYLINIDTVNKVSIAYDSQSHCMEYDNGVYKMDQKSVDKKAYCDMYSKLMGLEITKELPKKDSAKGDRVPVLSLKFDRNKGEEEEFNVAIFEYDELNDSIQVNGNEFFLIKKSDVVDLLATLKNKF